MFCAARFKFQGEKTKKLVRVYESRSFQLEEIRIEEQVPVKASATALAHPWNSRKRSQRTRVIQVSVGTHRNRVRCAAERREGNAHRFAKPWGNQRSLRAGARFHGQHLAYTLKRRSTTRCVSCSTEMTLTRRKNLALTGDQKRNSDREVATLIARRRRNEWWNRWSEAEERVAQRAQQEVGREREMQRKKEKEWDREGERGGWQKRKKKRERKERRREKKSKEVEVSNW